jgi:ABC-type transport system involved in cytochrome c biogenesis permease subunit
MALYVIAFVLAAMSWLKWRQPLGRAALWVMVLAIVVHTLGLVTRVYLQGRPPVTNLYSSAIFIAWAAALFCVFMELVYRNGLAVVAASAVAFPSLLIAHYLAADGDTMKMLQAVLDTNIWLATHVVVVSLGYTATFLAGFIAILGVIFAIIRSRDAELRKTLYRMVYGVVCFAMLFSFVGTILGGIWADQSWGRFWGWDPKENGAVLVVLWNAVLLHARWGGLVRERGFMLLAIGGNIVTAWSWFGTNMLGIGLHSYGFMDSAVLALLGFVALQLLIIGVGMIPADSLENLRQRVSRTPVGAGFPVQPPAGEQR